MMMFAIIETALIFFATQVMETATQDTARLIMTGQAQIGSMSAATVQDQPLYPPCRTVRLRRRRRRRGQELSDVRQHRPQQPDQRRQLQQPDEVISRAAPDDIVVVRTFYQWPLFVTSLGYNAGNLNNKQAAAGRDRRIPQRTGTVLDDPAPTVARARERTSTAGSSATHAARPRSSSRSSRRQSWRLFFGTAELAQGVARRSQGDDHGASAVGPRRAVDDDQRRRHDQHLRRRHRDHDAICGLAAEGARCRPSTSTQRQRDGRMGQRARTTPRGRRTMSSRSRRR